MDSVIQIRLEQGRQDVLKRSILMYNKCIDLIEQGIDVQQNMSLANMFSSSWEHYSSAVEIQKDIPKTWFTLEKVQNIFVKKTIMLNNIYVMVKSIDGTYSMHIDEEPVLFYKSIINVEKLFECMLTFYGPFLKLTVNDIEVYINKKILKKIDFETKDDTDFKLIVYGSHTRTFFTIKKEHREKIEKDIEKFESYCHPE